MPGVIDTRELFIKYIDISELEKHSKLTHLTPNPPLTVRRHSNAKYQKTSSYLLHLSHSMSCPSWGYKGQSRWHEKKPLVIVVWIGQTTIGNNDSIHEDADLHEVENNFVYFVFSVYH